MQHSTGEPVASRIGTRFNAEVVMSNHVTNPPKQVVREYLEQRAREKSPPPTPEEIRRQLGWGLTAQDFKPSLSRS
jgi:hypothetical protein